MSDHTNYNKDRIMSNSSPTSTSLFNSAESDVVSKQDIDEENLLKYWNPNKKWYHPLICTSVTLTSQFVMRFMNQVEFHHRQKWDDYDQSGYPSEWAAFMSFCNDI